MRPIPLWTLALIALAAMSSSSLPAAQTPAVRQPENVMTLLPNGMRLVAAPRSYNKVLSLNLFIEGGSAEDPPAKEGLTNLTQRLLLKGAAGKDAEELAETIESVGGHIGVATTNDYSEVSTVCTVEELDTALELLADVVLRPSFPDDEVERERQLVLSGIKRREDNPSGFTYLRFLREMYEGHPYAHPVEGEDLPVRTISREEIAAFHAQRLRPERMILAACGDVKTEDLAVKVQEAFEKIPTAMTAPRFIIGRQIKPHFVMQTLHKDVRQAFVVTGFPAIPLSDPDYPALRIAHAMLGEGMSSRLFRRLRDEQSMAYDVGSRVEARKVAGHLALWIGTSPRQRGKCAIVAPERGAIPDRGSHR